MDSIAVALNITFEEYMSALDEDPPALGRRLAAMKLEA